MRVQPRAAVTASGAARAPVGPAPVAALLSRTTSSTGMTDGGGSSRESDRADERARRQAAHLDDRGRDRGQARVGQPGEGDVVEAGDRDIARHREPTSPQPVEERQRELVVVADDRVRRPSAERLGHEVGPGPGVRGQVDGPGRPSVILADDALDGGSPEAVGRPSVRAQIGDVAMASRPKVPDRLLHAGLVVRPDGAGRQLLGRRGPTLVIGLHDDDRDGPATRARASSGSSTLEAMQMPSVLRSRNTVSARRSSSGTLRAVDDDDAVARLGRLHLEARGDLRVHRDRRGRRGAARRRGSAAPAGRAPRRWGRSRARGQPPRPSPACAR